VQEQNLNTPPVSPTASEISSPPTTEITFTDESSLFTNDEGYFADIASCMDEVEDEDDEVYHFESVGSVRPASTFIGSNEREHNDDDHNEEASSSPSSNVEPPTKKQKTNEQDDEFHDEVEKAKRDIQNNILSPVLIKYACGRFGYCTEALVNHYTILEVEHFGDAMYENDELHKLIQLYMKTEGPDWLKNIGLGTGICLLIGITFVSCVNVEKLMLNTRRARLISRVPSVASAVVENPENPSIPVAPSAAPAPVQRMNHRPGEAQSIWEVPQGDDPN